MAKSHLAAAIAVIGLAALLAVPCGCQPAPAVANAADARDAAIEYLQEHNAPDVPGGDIDWQEADTTPQGIAGAAYREFVSDEWTAELSYPVLPPELTVYQVVLSSIKLGWHWTGSVNPHGDVTELSPLRQMSEEESRRVAQDFVTRSPTFAFDAVEDSLRLVDTLTARCPACWLFLFEFECRHAGYGDRTGQTLAQAITPHRAAIAVERLEIASAVLDETWDMLAQEMREEQQADEAVSVSGPLAVRFSAGS